VLAVEKELAGWITFSKISVTSIREIADMKIKNCVIVALGPLFFFMI
jgi:hypothetical protein